MNGLQKSLVFRVIEAAAAKGGFEAGRSLVREEDVPVLSVGLVITSRSGNFDEPGQPAGVPRRPLPHPRYDQGHARLVDENGIGLVHERHMKRTMDEIPGRKRDPVAEKVETRLLGGGIGHVASVRATLVSGLSALPGATDSKAQKFVNEDPSRSRRAGPGSR